MFQSVKKYIISKGNKRYYCTKRKYPIDPDHAKSMPVFDYASPSKKNYRRVFVWGNVQTGALGVPYLRKGLSFDNMRESFKKPKRLGFAEKFPVITAACGFGFTAFAVDDPEKKLFGTGLNTDSQLGYHAVREGKPLGIIFFPQHIPLPISDKKTKIIKLKAGRAHLLILTDKEGLLLLGNNSYGQCGRQIIDNEDYTMSNYINHLWDIDGKKIIDIECGQDHTLALTEDGSVYSCGWGADGQTGLGIYQNCDEFVKVGGDIENEKITKLSSRSDFVLAINDKGDLFGWGNAEYGQITLPDGSQQICHPTYIKMVKPLGKIIDVAAAGASCMVLNENHHVFVWGFGILGAGPKVQQSNKPLQLAETLFGKNDFQPNNIVVKIGCGLNYFTAITNLGDLYTWGRNLKCCLGLGDEKDQFFPLKVPMGGMVQQVSCGLDHSVAICKPYI